MKFKWSTKIWKETPFPKPYAFMFMTKKTHMFWIETKTLAVVYSKMLNIPKPQWRNPNHAILRLWPFWGGENVTLSLVKWPLNRESILVTAFSSPGSQYWVWKFGSCWCFSRIYHKNIQKPWISKMLPRWLIFRCWWSLRLSNLTISTTRTTHLKNMRKSVKLDHFPQVVVKIKQIFETTT